MRSNSPLLPRGAPGARSARAPRPRWLGHQRLPLAVLLLAALARCAGAPSPGPRLTLSNFRPLRSFEVALNQSIYDKRSYFAHLATTYNFSSGFQRDAATGLCPTAHNASLAYPSCCLERKQGVRLAVFVGDSLAREVAWSFSRLAAAGAPAGAPEPCQSTGGEHERWAETKRDPSFSCAVASVGSAGDAICGPDAQVAPPATQTGYSRGEALGNVSDCCNASRFSL